MRAAVSQYGVENFQRFFGYVTSLPHIVKAQREEEDLDLHPQLATTVYAKYKEVVADVVWKNRDSCRNIWFSSQTPMPEDRQVDEFLVLSCPNRLEDQYQFRFGPDVYTVTLDESAVIQTIYNREGIYTAMGREFCTAMDVALAMSGSEAVVESYYSVMKSQQFHGGQSNQHLVLRTNADWLLPLPAHE
ncbi:hypothetical protein FJT64_018864 [Amphibalanus amphitrite]|uniref:Uncharacterized protein n=1 Tax=Amphibalanus amphitrite TaxID=1232801 RepID=A0A6A4WVN8_AMPAM|nr:hypothetical protein FJT64_018864 [Amphibalanus amphitrite]